MKVIIAGSRQGFVSSDVAEAVLNSKFVISESGIGNGRGRKRHCVTPSHGGQACRIASGVLRARATAGSILNLGLTWVTRRHWGRGKLGN